VEEGFQGRHLPFDSLLGEMVEEALDVPGREVVEL
jgi:hypothetical protein